MLTSPPRRMLLTRSDRAAMWKEIWFLSRGHGQVRLLWLPSSRAGLVLAGFVCIAGMRYVAGMNLHFFIPGVWIISRHH